jgi:hydroxyacylglutathione hydrolase
MILTMALVVDRFVLGAAQENCYVVRADRGASEAVVIDPGDGAAQLRLELAGMGTRCAGILLTHCHWDHLLGVADLAEGTGAPVYAPELELPVLEQPREFFPDVPLRPYEGAIGLNGAHPVDLAGISFETVAIPGHSPGHLAYHADGCLFSGDLLFAGSVGRVDRPGGSWDALLDSIRGLVERLPPETVVYPGHGPATTLGRELETNPFLDDLRAAAQ